MLAPRIILTRQPGQTGRLESQLTAAGVEVGLLPMLDFALPTSTDELSEHLERARKGEYDWIVITSPNTVRALNKMGYFNSALPVRWAMVGGGTADVFTKTSNLAPDFVATEQSGQGLVNQFPLTQETQKVLLPVSHIATRTVETGLREAGYRVTRITAYQTVSYGDVEPSRRILDTQESLYRIYTAEQLAETAATMAAIVLTSPSNTRAFLQHCEDFPALNLMTLLAIGNPTAAAVSEHGRIPEAVLPHPDADSIIAWLTEHHYL